MKRSVHLEVFDGELKARFEKWQRPKPRIRSGCLNLCARLAQSAARGAIIPHRASE